MILNEMSTSNVFLQFFTDKYRSLEPWIFFAVEPGARSFPPPVALIRSLKVAAMEPRFFWPWDPGAPLFYARGAKAVNPFGTLTIACDLAF